MYPAALCEGLAGFFWQLPLLVYIIWLFCLRLTSLSACYTTCGIRENPPSRTRIMQPPPSLYFFLITPLHPHLFLPDFRARHPSFHYLHLCFFLSSDQVFSPPLFFLRSLTSSPRCSLHPLPPSRHVKTPASCNLLCVCEDESI